jgi:hypothetical protein
VDCGWLECVREKALEPSGCLAFSITPVCEGKSAGTLVLDHLRVRGRKCSNLGLRGFLNHILQGWWRECRERDRAFYGDVGIVWVGYIINVLIVLKHRILFFKYQML